MSLGNLVDGHNKHDTMERRVRDAENNIDNLKLAAEILRHYGIDLGAAIQDLHVDFNSYVQHNTATLKLMGENLDNTHASSHEL